LATPVDATAVESTAAPVIRPQKSAWQLLREVLNHGGPGYLQFAITNICNADCDFCGFARSKFDPKARRSVTLQEGRDVVDICRRNHIGYLLFVGGEPMAHKDLLAMVRYAAEKGIHPMICTNGGLWTELNMPRYVDAGLTSVEMLQLAFLAHDDKVSPRETTLPGIAIEGGHNRCDSLINFGVRHNDEKVFSSTLGLDPLTMGCTLFENHIHDSFKNSTVVFIGKRNFFLVIRNMMSRSICPAFIPEYE